MSKPASPQGAAHPADRGMHRSASGRNGAQPVRLYMRETRGGTWVVREDGGRRGGSFFTRTAALRFIRREFGAGAHIVATYAVHTKAA